MSSSIPKFKTIAIVGQPSEWNLSNGIFFFYFFMVKNALNIKAVEFGIGYLLIRKTFIQKHYSRKN